MLHSSTSQVEDSDISGFLRTFYISWNAMLTAISFFLTSIYFKEYGREKILIFIVFSAMSTMVSYVMAYKIKIMPLGGMLNSSNSITTRIGIISFLLALLGQLFIFTISLQTWSEFWIGSFCISFLLLTWLSSKNIYIKIIKNVENKK